MPRLRGVALLLPILFSLGISSTATAGSRSLNCSTQGASISDSVLGLLLANVDTLTVSNLRPGDTLRFDTTRTGSTSSNHEISTAAGAAPLSDSFALIIPNATHTSNFLATSAGQKTFTIEITGILSPTRSADWKATCVRVLEPTATGGTPQAATVSTAFATALEATVTDAGGSPVSGVPVTFTAPGNGASAVLSSSTATTNAFGRASISATANAVAGIYLVTASVEGGATAATFQLTNTAGAPSQIAATAGTPQATSIVTAFATPLQAIVTDANGNPASGVVVTFSAPASGASATLSSSTATTNASGRASVTPTANAVAGFYSITASVDGVMTPAVFSLSNTASAAATVAASGGELQSAIILTGFAIPLEATVTDAGGNPVSGVVVTFASPGSGASATLSAPTATTDASGTASVTATANATAGPYTVTASAAGVAMQASFDLTNAVSAPASVTATDGTPQSASISSAFDAALEVSVADSGGNPVSGVVVTFTGPGSGASAVLSSATATTDAMGRAGVTATANATAGSYVVTASIAGVATPATFALSNTASSAAQVAATSGTPQSTSVTTAFGAALEVTVTDAGGNPVGGAVVTFTAPGSGASATLSSPTATTDATGRASITATANAIAGAYSIAASVPGVATPASFALTNAPGGPAMLSAMAGTPQSASVTTGFATALEAMVTDTEGNPVSGVVVSFAAPGTGAGAVLSASTATTDTNGSASVTATANTLAGSYAVTASAVGVAAPATFVLANTASAPADVQATGGTPQNTSVATSFPTALEVTVTDANGNPASGVVVTFSAPASGASATLSSSTATTNASGRASVTPTANAVAGFYSITASVDGVATPVFFLVQNTGITEVITITASGGTPQTTAVSTPFGGLFQATVTDPDGHPVSDVIVTFTAPASGASAILSSSTATTDSAGHASVSATANAVAGDYLVVATVADAASHASFALNNSAAASWTLLMSASPDKFSGPGQKIAFSFVIANSGSTAVSAISIFENLSGAVSCPSTYLSGGASMTCASSYLTTEADVLDGSFVVSAAATGTAASGPLVLRAQA